MIFLNPLILLATLGVALPILAHLLNRYQVKHTDWAAMQFLNRSVRIRSRQLKLKDILLLILRCLALLLIVFALSKPFLNDTSGNGLASTFGERRAGAVIALDGSFSMQHSDDNGTSTRFKRAVEKVGLIAETLHPGDPVCLVLLGAEHRVVMRNMAFDPNRFQELLENQHSTPESLDFDSVARKLKELAAEMDAPQKEIYIVSDLQEQDWNEGAARLRKAFDDQKEKEEASLFIIPVQGGSENLAITDLDLVSGVLRKGTTARYRATVRNFGATPAINVRVKGQVNNITVDTKTIPSIPAGSAETVSLFVPFNDAGPARITAGLEDDTLPADNIRRTVATIRERVSVLCVEGTSGGAGGGVIAAALRARGTSGRGQEDFSVQSVPWVALPGQDLEKFDVVILADVPDITPDQARQFDEFVRAGNGLVWFPGENMKPAVWNKRSSSLDGTPLLPAVIEQTISTGDELGMGSPLDPTIPDHSVCRPLFSLSEDLLSETRFLKMLQVKPSPASTTVLSIAGSTTPLLIEHAIGRGQVFLFTTSAEPSWNNMALTPVFPMLLQQMVTYLTAREFEKPRMVGNSLSLSYKDEPDASDAVFDTPSGETYTVPVRKKRNQYVATLDHAREDGFYLARVSVQAPGMPVAVNVDTKESNVKCLAEAGILSRFADSDIQVARSDDELLAAIDEARTGRSFWRFLLLAGLVLLVVESLLAERMLRKPARAFTTETKTPSTAATKSKKREAFS